MTTALTPHPSTANIRNVALVGHHGAGKTTLSEALLAFSGTISRQGSVDRGTTVCDCEPESVARHLSIGLGLAPFMVGEVKVNLVDTPGYPDFADELEAALQVVDLALVVVSAVDGVQPQTEEAWHRAGALGLPRMLVVDKLDRERADFDRVLAELVAAFGPAITSVELPLGSDRAFRGVVDLLDDQAVCYDLDHGPPVAGHPEPLPDDLATIERAAHEQLLEGIVVADDDLMTRYLDGDPISRGELERALAAGVASGSVFPVLCCSGTNGVGVDRLAEFLVALVPSPDRRPPTAVQAGGTLVTVPFDPDSSPLAVVVETLADARTGRLSVAKVLSGTIRPDTVLTNSRSHGEERLHTIGALRGHELLPVDEVPAGDLFAAPKLASTLTGDTLAPNGTPVTVGWPSPTPPSLRVAVHPASRNDDDRLMDALRRLGEEDGHLSVSQIDETHQTVLGVAGDVHLAVTIERLARRFGVTVEAEELRVPYREALAGAVSTEGRHKKQSGGHGQFAVCHVRFEPLPRGDGFRFADEVVGGAIPRQYIPAVERGIVEAMAAGGRYGFPVVDLAATVDEGKHHAVDSSELAFKAAGALAFRHAVAEIGSVLLEPIDLVEVEVPIDRQGEVLGDLAARRAHIMGTEADDDGIQRIRAFVPEAEIRRYAIDIRALTGGRGRHRAVRDHYDPVPEHLVPAVLAGLAGLQSP